MPVTASFLPVVNQGEPGVMEEHFRPRQSHDRSNALLHGRAVAVDGTSGTGRLCRSETALLESLTRVSAKIRAGLAKRVGTVPTGAGNANHDLDRSYFSLN